MEILFKKDMASKCQIRNKSDKKSQVHAMQILKFDFLIDLIYSLY